MSITLNQIEAGLADLGVSRERGFRVLRRDDRETLHVMATSKTNGDVLAVAICSNGLSDAATLVNQFADTWRAKAVPDGAPALTR